MILAFDTATKCGFAVLVDDGEDAVLLESGMVVLGSSDSPDGARVCAFQDLLERLVRDHEPVDLVAWEVPTPRSHNAAPIQYALVGVLEAWCWRAGVATFSAHPSTIKKSQAGHGHATKDDMIAAVKRRFPELADEWIDDNRADAILIGLHALEAS